MDCDIPCTLAKRPVFETRETLLKRTELGHPHDDFINLFMSMYIRCRKKIATA